MEGAIKLTEPEDRKWDCCDAGPDIIMKTYCACRFLIKEQINLVSIWSLNCILGHYVERDNVKNACGFLTRPASPC